MARRFHHPELPDRGTVRLSAATSRHVLNVMRMHAGDEIVLFDGRGRVARCTIRETRHGRVTARILARHRAPAHPLRRIELAFSPPRRARCDQILEHGTELGVAAFRPVWMQRTPPAGRHAMRPDRWEKILTSAAGQAGLARVPDVHAPREFGDFLAAVLADFAGERWVAAPGSARPRPAARPPEDLPPVLLVTGPEGGLTGAELDLLEKGGCQRLGLGAHVLRIETAVLAAVTLLTLSPPAHAAETGA